MNTLPREGKVSDKNFYIGKEHTLKINHLLILLLLCLCLVRNRLVVLNFWLRIPGPKFCHEEGSFSFRKKKKNCIKSMNFGVRKSELKVQFCHLVVVGP